MFIDLEYNYPLLFPKLLSGSKASFKKISTPKASSYLLPPSFPYQHSQVLKSWIHFVSLNFHSPLFSKFSGYSHPCLHPPVSRDHHSCFKDFIPGITSRYIFSWFFYCLSYQYLNMFQVSLILERKKKKKKHLFTLFLIQMATTPFLLFLHNQVLPIANTLLSFHILPPSHSESENVKVEVIQSCPTSFGTPWTG